MQNLNVSQLNSIEKNYVFRGISKAHNVSSISFMMDECYFFHKCISVNRVS